MTTRARDEDRPDWPAIGKAFWRGAVYGLACVGSAKVIVALFTLIAAAFP